MKNKLDDRSWLDAAFDQPYSGTMPVFDPDDFYDTHLEQTEEIETIILD